jgi:hypothetical protein
MSKDSGENLVLATNGDALGFTKLSKAEFSFLIQPPFSMALVDQEPLAIGFEGNGIALMVFQDRQSYELGIALWRPVAASEVDRPYTISDLIRVTDTAAANRYRRFAATTTDALQHGLAKLAADLRNFGSRALQNDPASYRRLSEAREGAVREFGRDQSVRVARIAGESAWLARDWYKVAEAYGAVADSLTPAERERLAYARRKLLGDA